MRTRVSYVPPKASLPSGLPNVGNTCFLNAILQFLYAAQDIRNPLISTYGKQENLSQAKCSKLIGKLFLFLQEKQNQSKTWVILLKMVAKLESMNTQYKRHLQEDALQTLLNILLQIQEKHPSITKLLDAQYKSRCDCRQNYVTKERIISYSQNTCVKCKKLIQRSFINKPKYIIYSNAAGQAINLIKEQNLETEKESLSVKYKIKAQIIYIGNGAYGHYKTRRFDQGELYQFNDSSVRTISKQQLEDRKALILLYQLDQGQSFSSKMQKQDARPNQKILPQCERVNNLLDARQKEQMKVAARSSTCSKKEEDKLPIGLKNSGVTGLLSALVQFMYAAVQMKEGLIQRYGLQINMQGAKLGKLLGKLFFYLSNNSKEQAKIDQLLSAMALQLQPANFPLKHNYLRDPSSVLLNIFSEISEKHPQAVHIFDVEYKLKCGCIPQTVKSQRVLSYAQDSCQKCRKPTKRTLNNPPQYIIFRNPSKLQTNDSVKLEVSDYKSVVYSLKAQIIEIGQGSLRRFAVRREDGKRWYQFQGEKVTVDRGKKPAKSGAILLYRRQQTVIVNNYCIQEVKQEQERQDDYKPILSKRIPPLQSQKLSLKIVLDKVYLFRIWVIKDMLRKPPTYEQRDCFAKIIERKQIFYVDLVNQANFPDFEGIHNFHQFFRDLTDRRVENELQVVGNLLQTHIDKCLKSKYTLLQECQRYNRNNEATKRKQSYKGPVYQQYQVKAKNVR